MALVSLGGRAALAQAPRRPSSAMDAPDPLERPSALEQPTPRPSPQMDAPDPPGEADAQSPSGSAPSEWKLAYEEARAKLALGEFGLAATLFAALEASAQSEVDRALAHAQRVLAAEWASRKLTLVPATEAQSIARETALASKAEDRRSTDELVSLYSNSVAYGIGSGVWLATLTKPETAATGILPTLALTAGSVGTVMALDSGKRGLRYGVPQSIVSGLYVGLEQGVMWTYFVAASSDHDGKPDPPASTYSTLLWASSTAGAVAGGILGEKIGTTPGRASWVGSTTLWTGLVSALTAGATAGDSNATAVPITGIVGLAVGTAIGFGTASSVSPPISRVRLLDLSGLLGGLGAVGLYVAAANDKTDGRAAAGVTALGIAGGLGLGWLATSSMGRDYPREADPSAEAEDDARSPVRRFFAKLTPSVLPASGGGAMIGAAGSLD